MKQISDSSISEFDEKERKRKEIIETPIMSCLPRARGKSHRIRPKSLRNENAKTSESEKSIREDEL